MPPPAQRKALHVAMLGSMPPAAGISAYCLELARAVSRLVPIDFLAFRRMYPRFLHPGGAPLDDTMPDVSRDGLRIRRRLTWYNPAGWVWCGLRTPGDVLHAQWWSWPLGVVYFVILLLFKLRGRPIVLTMHNVSAHEAGPLSRLMDRLVVSLADRFVVHSARNFQQLRRRYGIAPERIARVPHGRLDFMAERHVTRDEARAELGISPDRPTVLYFGAIRPYKGLDDLLEAVRLVGRQVPDVLLIIAGRCWGDWREYAEQIERLGLRDRVLLRLDFVPSGEVGTYFQAADVVVLPYRHFESQTGVGMVALAFGKPLVVTDVGGLPDLVEDPENVVPPEDPQALAAGIARALADPGRLAAMSAASRRRAEQFDWADIAARTVDLYHELATKRS